MSKKLSLVALVVAAVGATVADVPREIVVPLAATLAFALAVWAYGRSFAAWVAAGTHYGV